VLLSQNFLHPPSLTTELSSPYCTLEFML
jgi:hypothetical protein